KSNLAIAGMPYHKTHVFIDLTDVLNENANCEIHDRGSSDCCNATIGPVIEIFFCFCRLSGIGSLRVDQFRG
ncbi:MAG: hypothetical protein ACYSUH_03860, partial [Planctomycetota bacterium]